MARATFEDTGEIYRLWRYVNAMQLAAYCGLTDHLTETNFFTPLCTKHGLLGSKKIREEELAAVSKVGIDANGVRASSMFEVRSPLSQPRTSALCVGTLGHLARQPLTNGVPRRSGRWR